MFKRALSLLALCVAVAFPACLTLTIPTDYLTVDAFRRANQAANWTATATAHNDCKDSLNQVLARMVNWTGNLQLKSLQDFALKLDDDNNGTHKFAILQGTSDTLFKVAEDSTVTIPKLTASQAVFTNSGKGLVSNSVTGSGAVVMSVSPTLTGTLTAAAANFSGTVAGAASTWSSTVGVTGNLTASAAAILDNGRTGFAADVNDAYIYRTNSSGGSYPFTGFGHLVIQPRTSTGSAMDIVFATGSGTPTVRYKITGAGDHEMTGNLGVGGTPVHNLDVAKSTSGSAVSGAVRNTSNTASSDARFRMEVAGTSAGDAFSNWVVSGTTEWSMGIDNSVAGDPLVIAASGAPGTSNAVSITTAADITFSGNITPSKRVLGKEGANVASANDITLGDGNFFRVTGTTALNRIASAGWTAGSVVTLQFASTPNVNDSRSAANGGGFIGICVDGAAAWTTVTAEDTITLLYNGTCWNEIGRSVLAP